MFELENISHRSSLSCLTAIAFSLVLVPPALLAPSLLLRCRRASRCGGVASAWAGHDAEARAALDTAAQWRWRPQLWADQRGRPDTRGSTADLAPSPSRAGVASLSRRAAPDAGPLPTSAIRPLPPVNSTRWWASILAKQQGNVALRWKCMLQAYVPNISDDSEVCCKCFIRMLEK
jgi:hypothetical protein